MVTVVTADDLWVLLVGWELMGACSYFLIAHHWELADARAGRGEGVPDHPDRRPGAAVRDLRARRPVRHLPDQHDDAPRSPRRRCRRDELWLPALLIAVAVIGKSAQLPFHTWLPDAMPGPTPISALIHAATMVAAGVFLVARTYPLFLSAPSR